MRVGIQDIAKAAGVSKSTVSNVINGKSNVGAATRQRVLETCRKYGYYPHRGSNPETQLKNRAILFNFSEFDRSFYLKIIEGIHDYCGSSGYDLMICTSKAGEKYMRSGLTDGAIILDSRMDNESLYRCAGEHYPIVVLDRILNHPSIKSLVVDNYSPMAELMQSLVDRGYKKFGFLSGPEQTQDNIERFGAFREVLERNDISFYSKNYFSGDYKEKSGYKAAKIIMLAQEKPDILVCANDNMAIGAMRYFREKGYRVPEDIAVTGFDDCELARMMGLTTVTIPNFERGYLAARYLLENIRGEPNSEMISINASVKWRKSVR